MDRQPIACDTCLKSCKQNFRGICSHYAQHWVNNPKSIRKIKHKDDYIRVYLKIKKSDARKILYGKNDEDYMIALRNILIEKYPDFDEENK